jgi:hypothetical protein
VAGAVLGAVVGACPASGLAPMHNQNPAVAIRAARCMVFMAEVYVWVIGSRRVDQSFGNRPVSGSVIADFAVCDTWRAQGMAERSVAVHRTAAGNEQCATSSEQRVGG